MAGGAGGMPVLPAWATFGVCRIMHAFDQDRDGILSLTEFNNFQVGGQCVWCPQCVISHTLLGGAIGGVADCLGQPSELFSGRF